MTNLVLVCGNAGSGKTYIGKLLTKKFLPCVYMDKDTLSRPLVENLLTQLGSHPNDRESDIYLNQVRPLEYEVLMKHAKENLELGLSTIVSAPFIKELNDSSWLDNLKEELEFEDVKVTVVWIESDESTMKKRIISRNAGRDEWKLKNWTTYLNNINIQSPILDAITIINSEGYDIPLLTQIEDKF